MTGPISRISSSPMPRVVSAGVPMRMPEVTIGGRSSNGIDVLVHRDAGAVQRVLAVLPGERPGREVDQHQVVVGAAAARGASPARCSASASAAAFVDDLLLAGLELGLERSPKATALPAMTCISGPPWMPGKTAWSTVLRVARSRAQDQAGRAGRAASCAWWWSRSRRRGTGWGAGRRRPGPRCGPCRPSAARPPRRRSRGRPRSR